MTTSKLHHPLQHPLHRPFRHSSNRSKNLPPLRVGNGGPVGSGKTILLEMLCKLMTTKYDLVAVTNDIYIKEEPAHPHRQRRVGYVPPDGC